MMLPIKLVLRGGVSAVDQLGREAVGDRLDELQLARDDPGDRHHNFDDVPERAEHTAISSASQIVSERPGHTRSGVDRVSGPKGHKRCWGAQPVLPRYLPLV